MLGQPVTMLIPHVVGFELKGRLAEGATATDLVLTVTEMLRKHGVVGKFVEFFGDGLDHLPLADRATIGNMSPEFGSTCAVFPIDAETLRYLELSGRPRALIDLVERYAKTQGLWRGGRARYTSTLTLDLATVEPSFSGPKRPHERVALHAAAATTRKLLAPTPAKNCGARSLGSAFKRRRSPMPWMADSTSRCSSAGAALPREAQRPRRWAGLTACTRAGS